MLSIETLELKRVAGQSPVECCVRVSDCDAVRHLLVPQLTPSRLIRNAFHLQSSILNSQIDRNDKVDIANRLTLIATLVTAVFFIFAPLLAEDSNRPESDRPNIVFVFIDDMGYADPSCFGNPHVKTPHIDQLAADGLRLTNFYVNSPICSPSRVAVTTGQYPARWKIHSYLNTRAGNRSRGMRNYLDQAAPTTARKLKSVGYATAHFGKWHMGGGRDVDDAPLPNAYGFDESLVAFEGLGDRLLVNRKNSSVQLGHGRISFCERWEKTQKYTDRAIDFIRRHQKQPFYVRLFPNDVHDAHVPRPGTEEKWKSVTDNPWEQKFFAVLEELDTQIGRLVDEIDRLGLADRTLIVFTSDNGPTDWPKYYSSPAGAPPGFTGPFFGRKWSLFEGGIRMPFIARWKGTIPAGKKDATSIMSGIDLSPTFCRLAGVEGEALEELDGIDRSAVLFGQPTPRGEPLFWQYGAPHAVLKPGKLEFQSPTFAVRDGEWKLLTNADGTEARLFHLVNDPGEQENLLERQRPIARSLQRKLGDWAESVELEFDATAALALPVPAVAVRTNNQLLRFQSQGVKTTDSGAWEFDRRAWLDLPRRHAPRISGQRWIRLAATIEPTDPNGVVLAHGGDRWGYTVYVKNNHLVMATCVDWKRTAVTSPEPLPSGPVRFEAFWNGSGSMQLKVEDKLVAKGTAAGVIASEPGDSVQIGADLIKPVGDYEVPFAFQGTIHELHLKYARNPARR